MKTKLGRPEMPEGKANTELIHLRLSGEIGEAVDKAAKKAKQEKPEWMRDALLAKTKNPPVFFKSKWKPEELNGNLIEFRLDSPKRLLSGIGELKAHENARGEISIDIFIDEPNKGISTRIWLAQDAADKIELNPKPKPAKFRLLG
jgi:hypothetical protein